MEKTLCSSKKHLHKHGRVKSLHGADQLHHRSQSFVKAPKSFSFEKWESFNQNAFQNFETHFHQSKCILVATSIFITIEKMEARLSHPLHEVEPCMCIIHVTCVSILPSNPWTKFEYDLSAYTYIISPTLTLLISPSTCHEASCTIMLRFYLKVSKTHFQAMSNMWKRMQKC